MTGEKTVPILPCHSINEMLSFYRVLGFEITYQQSKPNNYACVRRGDIELHFFSMRDYVPENSYSTCIVQVPDVDKLYQEFASGLRQAFGKLPVTGIPRVTPLRNRSTGTRGFNVIDPGGNWIRIGQKVEEKIVEESEVTSTKLARALPAAELLAHSKADYATAAKVLDKSLSYDEPVSNIHYIQALVLRAELAIAMNDHVIARKMLTDIRQIILSNEEQTLLSSELQRVEDLEKML